MLNEAAEQVRGRLESLLPPLAFDENSHSTALLSEMISERRLPHALIIEGGSDEYNSRIAHLIAQSYLCSCGSPLLGECRTCHLFETYGTHPDMYAIEGSGASGAISVDSVRGAKKHSGIIPTDASGTVFLLEHSELMQKQAQNAFLKLFEEPPDGLMLILTCTSRMKLLETIRSRGTVFHFEWPQDREGSDAAAAYETAQALALAVIAPSDADLLFALAPFCSGSVRADGQNMRRQLDKCLEALEEIFRQAVIIAAGAGDYLESEEKNKNGTGAYVSDAARELSAAVSAERLTVLTYELEPLRRALKNNASMPLLTSAITERLRRAAGR